MLLPRGPALGRPRVAVARCGAASVSGGAWEPRPSSRARSGRCFTRLGNLSPTLIGTNEGSYRQLMGKRATVILSERERRDGMVQEVGGKVVAAQMQPISDNSTAHLC